MRKLKLGIELDEKDIQLKVALAELRLNLYDLSDLESPLNLRNPPPEGRKCVTRCSAEACNFMYGIGAIKRKEPPFCTPPKETCDGP